MNENAEMFVKEYCKKYVKGQERHGGNMWEMGLLELIDNAKMFVKEYCKKYVGGAERHGGNMWEMGLQQLVDNAKDEVKDQWSYLLDIERKVKEIQHLLNDLEEDELEIFYYGVKDILKGTKTERDNQEDKSYHTRTCTCPKEWIGDWYAS
jgi:hypothetical protein